MFVLASSWCGETVWRSCPASHHSWTLDKGATSFSLPAGGMTPALAVARGIIASISPHLASGRVTPALALPSPLQKLPRAWDSRGSGCRADQSGGDSASVSHATALQRRRTPPCALRLCRRKRAGAQRCNRARLRFPSVRLGLVKARRHRGTARSMKSRQSIALPEPSKPSALTLSDACLIASQVYF